MARSEETKSGFCRSFDWKIDIRWFDLTGVTRIDDGRIARIQLETRGTHAQYEGFLVKVLNKREGVIDQKYFLFDDYLNPALKARTDGRDDYPLRGNLCFKVHGPCWDWYIARPKSTRSLCDAIENWLEMFR